MKIIVLFHEESMLENVTYKTKFGNARLRKRDRYLYITSLKEGNNGVAVHRLVWEDHYKTKIPKKYDIHHINENKTDNRIQNLQCVKKRIHLQHHRIGKTFSKTRNLFSKETLAELKKCVTHRGIFKTRGVYLLKSCNPEKRCWNCRSRYNKKITSLGLYEDPFTAQIVYDLVRKEIYLK